MVYQIYAFYHLNNKLNLNLNYMMKKKDQKKKFYLKVCKRFKAKYDLKHLH
jgi:hypothetical protein